MTLHITPDEAGRGGFALLQLPAGSLAEDTATVTVYQAYSGRWLGPSEPDADGLVTVGDPLWQGEPHAFGPYQVERAAGVDRLRIGPEVVNKLDDNTMLRFGIGPVQLDAIWPTTVVPQPGRPLVGRILTRTPAAAHGLRGDTIDSQTPLPKAPPPDPPAVPRQEPSSPPAPAQSKPAPSRPAWLLPVAGLAGLALLGATLLLLQWPDRGQTSGGAAPQPDIAQPACDFDGLSTVGEGYGARFAALQNCGSYADPETALRLIEAGVSAGDATALLHMGGLYDAAVEDALVKDEIGLDLGDNPAVAAGFYAEAAAAGAEAAQARLRALCTRLAGLSDTLSRGAHDDHCG